MVIDTSFLTLRLQLTQYIILKMQTQILPECNVATKGRKKVSKKLKGIRERLLTIKYSRDYTLGARTDFRLFSYTHSYHVLARGSGSDFGINCT